MIISFDLDGTICDSDSTILALLHERQRAAHPGTEKDSATLLLKHYYLTRKVVLDPWDFAMPIVDSIIIITGRSAMYQVWTTDWAMEWLPGARLFFAASDISEKLFAAGQYEEGSKVLAGTKLAYIEAAHAEVHFDNNPYIVTELRKAGVKAILVGRALS